MNRSASTLQGLLSWWPTLAGVALAGFVAYDTSSGSELAPILLQRDRSSAVCSTRCSPWP